MADTLERLSLAIADRYTIERELGEGGMAIVYLAEDLKVHRKVAIKVLRPELAATIGTERFLREIEIGGQLSHPNILPIFDSGEADGFLYYVMPFVEGESLRDRLYRETQLRVDDALQITREVADALGYSHDKGIMHRDIKPENILLSGGRAIVADFGIARAVTMAGGEKLTQTGMAIGTPAYMSPEQATGTRNVDHRTDIYALACVAYEMLAGEAPYTGPTAQAIIAKRFSDPVPSIRRVRTAVSEDIDAAIEKALEKTPADRFDSTERFIQALTGERPVRSSTRSSQRLGMNRWVGAAVAGVFLVAAGVGISTIIGSDGEASEPVTVVMASTTVVGADDALASAIDIALENAMLESEHVTMLSPRQIQLAFEALGREPESELDQETALAIARRSGAAAVVQPSVLAVGSGYMINVRMLGPDGASLAVSQASTERAADLMPALDSLQIDVRRKLGESQRDLENSPSLLYVTTPSAEAFALYAQALGQTLDPLRQLELIERALALDSNFAMANSVSIGARQNIGLDFLAPTERLLRTADRLPTYVRIFFEADGAQSAERDFEKSVERAMLLLDLIPSSGLASAEVWGNGGYNTLAMAHMDLGNFERATRVFDEWHDSIQSGAAVAGVYYGNRALMMAQQGDYAGATRLALDHNRAGNLHTGWVAAASRRWADAAEAFEQAARDGSSPPGEQLQPSLYLATVEAVRGRPRSSRAEFDRAISLAQRIGLPYLTAIAQVLRAAAEFFALGDPERASVPLASMFSTAAPESGGMLRRSHAHGRAIAAAICAHLPATPQEGPIAQLDCGAPVTTDSIYDTIETLERLGWEALGTGDLQRAIDIGNEPRLGRAGGVGLRARVPAAIAMERQGRADSSAAFFGRLAETPFGLVSNAFSAFLMQSYGLQRLAAMEGERGRAAREKLRVWWADAEPEFRRRVVEPLIGNGR